MNPLLTRIYESKTRSQSKGSRKLNSSTDKVLVPKLAAKVKLEAINVPQIAQRQKTTSIKPYMGRLPSLYKQGTSEQVSQTQKRMQKNKSRGDFRNRRLSSHIRQSETSILREFQSSLPFAAQEKIVSSLQRENGLQSSLRRIPTISKQTGLMVPQTFVQQYMRKKSKQKVVQTKEYPMMKVSQSKRQQLLRTQSKEEQQQDQLFQYLKILQTNLDLKQQFCYMNRAQKPYSFYIVDYDKRNLNQHLTVSLRGITYYKTEQDEAESQFFTIKSMARDIQRYKVLKKIFFFKNYALLKTLSHWKMSMVKKKFVNQGDYLKDNLLSQNYINHTFFMHLHSLYQKHYNGNFFLFNITTTLPSLTELKDNHIQQRKKQIDREWNAFEKETRQRLLQCLNENMKRFRVQKRVTLGTSDKLQKSESFLPFDNKKKSMKFTQLAKLKQFEGYLYKIIKYTDMMRFNLKIENAKCSLINSAREMQTLLSNYENRSSRTFVSWMECHVEIVEETVVEIQGISQEEQSYFMTNENNLILQTQGRTNSLRKESLLPAKTVHTIKITPSTDDIRQCFLQHKEQRIKQLWSTHFFLTEQKNQLLCSDLELQENQFPTKMDLCYHLRKTPELIELNAVFDKSLNLILEKIEQQRKYLNDNILTIYTDSFINQPIQNYLQNQTLKHYLDTYPTQKETIQKCQEFIEFGLVLLQMEKFKLEVKKLHQDKYKAIVTAIPQQVLKRTQLVAKQVRDIYIKFKSNPDTIKEFIEFYRMFQSEKEKLFILENKILDLLELESMIQNNGIKVPENSRVHIAESQNLFRELEKRFEEIEGNQQKDRKNFQLSVENMIPLVEQKAEKLIQEIQNCENFHDPMASMSSVLQKLKGFSQKFFKVKNKKQELFLYQVELKLGHKDLEKYFRLEVVFDWYKKVWEGHEQFLLIQAVTKQNGYGHIQSIDIQPLVKHLKNVENAQSDIQAVDLLQNFKQRTIKLMHVIKLSRLIATQTLQLQHCDQIRKMMSFKVKKIESLLFTRQGRREITCNDLYENTNIAQIQNEVAEIAFLSAQQNIIKKHLSEVQEFWRKNKVKFISEDIIGNGNLVMHLDQNQYLYQKIGLFNLGLKNIQSSGQAKGLVYQRLQVQLKITVYLRKLLMLWDQVQKQWLRLLPMMTNSPSVKHQSNVYYEFTSVDSMMKKLIKRVSDMSSMRKLVQDYQEKKNIHALDKCKSQLKSINKIFQNFLETKRATYNRFYFLTDEQLVSIIENVKDSRSIAKYGGYCFNCIELDMDNQLINGFKTHNQIFRLRKLMLRGEPDQMFKSISENMKNSMKFGLRNLIPKMKISTNIELELRENSLQVCLLADLIIWTQMGETYLNANSYDQYYLITKGPAEEMTRLMPKCTKDLWLKLASRLCQALYLKQISATLVQDQVQKKDFKWKQQLKLYFQEDQISFKQFDHKMLHQLQYYPPQRIFVSTLNTQRFLYESFYACLNYKIFSINGQQGEGKRNLVKFTATQLGVYYKEVVCNSNLKINYLMRFVQGAIQAGAWLSFYQSSNLKNQVAYQLFENIAKLTQEKKCHPRTLFMLTNHGDQYQKINMFKYHNYTVVQPDHKKICDYLLQMYRFRQWEELSKKILSYLKTIKPLMENIMGSHLSLIRKIVDGAGQKKINSKIADNQNDMVVEMIRKQIINKSQQNLAILLKRALVSYFNTQQQPQDPKVKYNQKLTVLKEIIQRKDSKNILVIGNRSCKSTLIMQAVNQLNIDAIKLFPEAETDFLTPYSIDYLNLIPADKLLIYDGDNVISEFTDMITSGYLLIEGRKLMIKQKIILELRNIQNCSPSFIENCEIIYVGNVVSKEEKFLKYCQIDKTGPVWKILQEIFGEQLHKLNDDLIETFAKLVNRYKGISQPRSLQKIIIWLLSVLQNEDIWQRNYAGKYTDFTLHDKFLELVPIDPSTSSPVKFNDSNFYYVPTKTSMLLTELTTCLINVGLHVHAYGNQQSGKTTYLKLLKGVKINLSVYNKTDYWSEYLKDKLLVVRKQAKNYLMPIADVPYRIIIDDIDLGLTAHRSFARALSQASEMRDSKYYRYFMEHFHLVVTSREKSFKNKLDESLVKLPLLNQSKQSLSTIFLVNINNYVKSHNMNREVADYIDRTVLKSFLIAFDDLSNLYGSNVSTSHLIQLLKDMLSIPKKNSFISVEDFSSLFKSLLYQKIVQKSFNKRIKWQLKSVYENIAKLLFNNDQQWSHWINLDSHYKKTTLQETQALFKSRFSNVIAYPDMVEKIISINNQLQSINSNIAVIGRKGVGKRFVSKIAASFNKIQTIQTIKDAIFNSINKHPCVFVEQVKRNNITMYQQLNQCQIDEDLQKFLELTEKEKLRQHMKSHDGFQSVQIITKIKNQIKFMIFLDDTHQYLKVCEEFRNFNEFSVCILEEWPIEAIVKVYKTNDGNEKVHSQIFLKCNQLMSLNGLNYMPMTIYEKYIEIFTKTYEEKKGKLEQKKENLSKIYYKFNESCSIIRNWQQKVGSLQIQIKEKIDDLNKHIQINKEINSLAYSMKKQLDEKQNDIKDKKNRLQISKKEMQDEMKQTKLILSKIEKIINSLQRTEMGELKKIYKTNKLVQFGLECLCILLKQSEDDLNQKTINKLLADPNLLMKMKSPQILEVQNTYLVMKIKKEFPMHEHQMKTHTTETAKILVEWVRAIIEYWETAELYDDKKTLFQNLEDEYQKVEGDYGRISAQLKSLNDKTQKNTQELAKFQKQKSLKEIQLLSINQKIENASQIIPILLKAEQQVEAVLRKVNIILNNLLGNCILVAFTAAYLPLRRLSIRSKLLDSARKILHSSIIPFSESFIHDVISQSVFANDIDGDFDNLQNLNIFLIQNFPCRLRVIIDPERKAFNSLGNYNRKDLSYITDQIVEKTQELKEEELSKQKIYHSTSQVLLFQLEKCLVIDWKTIENNPEERLFNRIALSKKPEYFETKNQLKKKVEQNLNKIYQMKNQLYQVICQSILSILEDEKFLQNGRKLILLQQETKMLQKQIISKTQLIHNLHIEISSEVNKIFILLRNFKTIRPIGLNLILDAASMNGNSIQNVLSWAIANLPSQKRSGYLLAVSNQFLNHQQQGLLNEMIVNAPLKNNEVRIKKPTFVNAGNWQKIQRISTYSQRLKHMIEIVQRHQKQFQTWLNNNSPILPLNLSPQNLSMNEHLFIIYHLKQKIFSQSVDVLVKKSLSPYEVKPFKNIDLFTQTNHLFPLVYHCEISKLEKLCEEINLGKMEKVRIGAIKSESQMKKRIWKCMENGQWMVLYGIATLQNITWLERIVYYVFNYQSHPGFRVLIIPNAPQQPNSKLTCISSSKYLSSVCIHIYDEIPQYIELIKYFQLYQELSLAQNKSKVISIFVQEDTIKFSRLNSRVRKASGGNDKITSLLKLDKASTFAPYFNLKQETGNLLSVPLPSQSLNLSNGSFTLMSKGTDRLLNRLYKHILLAYLVMLRRFSGKNFNNSFELLKRSVQVLKYIEQNSVPIQFNVESIATHIQIIYWNSLPFENRKCLEGLMERIVDEGKFNDKIIFGVNIANFTNVQAELQCNSSILGTENSFFIREGIANSKNILKTLSQIIEPQDIKEETIFLRTTLSKPPILLVHKDIANQNYLNFFQKEEKIHNDFIKRTAELLNWINTYANKTENGQEIQPQNEYNWSNLLRQVRKLMGFNFNKNQLRDVVSNFISNLRKSHDFLLYLNPFLTSFTVNPLLVSNFQGLIATYTINYFSTNNIKDAFNYVPNFEFIKISTNLELNELMQYGVDGIVMNNLKLRDFRWNNQFRQIESMVGDLEGEEKAPVVFYKLRKLKNTQKEEEEVVLNLAIKEKTTLRSDVQERVLLSIPFMCNSIYPEFNLRQGSIVLQDINN